MNGMSGVYAKIFKSAPYPATGDRGYTMLIALCCAVISTAILLIDRSEKIRIEKRAVGCMTGYGALCNIANYLLLIGLASGTLVNYEAFLGFSSKITNTAIAMPGSFADFIINIRNASLLPSIRIILIVGLAALVSFFLITILYYRVFAFDFVRMGNADELVNKIIEAVGGKDNIVYSGAGLFKLNVYLNDPELIVIDKIRELTVGRVAETKDGVSFELGTSAFSLAKRINKQLD